MALFPTLFPNYQEVASLAKFPQGHFIGPFLEIKDPAVFLKYRHDLKYVVPKFKDLDVNLDYVALHKAYEALTYEIVEEVSKEGIIYIINDLCWEFDPNP